jgi:hypothetical protein
MARPGGQLDRSLDALTSGLIRGKAARESQLAHTEAREIEQQVRVPLSGKAGSEWGSIDKKVGLALPFIWAPDQRGVPFKTPHFSYGIELGVGSNVLVVVHAQVVNWTKNDSSWIIGAKMRFAAIAPGSGVTPVSFSAMAHLTFQGWAAESEEGELA